MWPYHVGEGFSGGSDGKETACNVGDWGSVPGLGRSPREGKGYPLQYSCRENPHGQKQPGGLQSIRSQRVGHDWMTNITFTWVKASTRLHSESRCNTWIPGRAAHRAVGLRGAPADAGRAVLLTGGLHLVDVLQQVLPLVDDVEGQVVHGQGLVRVVLQALLRDREVLRVEVIHLLRKLIVPRLQVWDDLTREIICLGPRREGWKPAVTPQGRVREEEMDATASAGHRSQGTGLLLAKDRTVRPLKMTTTESN